MNHIRKSISHYRLSTIYFPYLLGSYQAITSHTRQQYFKLTAVTKSLEDKLRANMFSVFGYDFSTCLHKDSGSLGFIVLSTALMELLDEITQGNTIIPPDYLFGSSEREQIYRAQEYIRGFFDQRAKIITSNRRILSSPFLRIKPRIVIKKENEKILNEVGKLLILLGLSPTKPIKKKGSIGYYYAININRMRDTRRVIEIPLLSSQEKLGRLKELYCTWQDLMKEDKYGVLGRRLLKAKEEKRKQELLT